MIDFGEVLVRELLVRELAASDPEGVGHTCIWCYPTTWLRWDPADRNVTDHKPDCLWRRANEAVEQSDREAPNP